MAARLAGDLDGLEAAQRLIEAPDLDALLDIAPPIFSNLCGSEQAILFEVAGAPGRGAILRRRLHNVGADESDVYERGFYRSDPLVAGMALEGRKAGVAALSLDDVCGPRRTERTPFYREFLGPIGLRHVLGLVAPRGGGRVVMVGVHRPIGVAGFTAAERRRAEALAHVLGLAASRFADAPAQQFVAGGGVHDLTAREAEVASLAADGLRNRDIAKRLGLSVRTVENHLRSIFEKLGVENRASLAARAWGARRN